MASAKDSEVLARNSGGGQKTCVFRKISLNLQLFTVGPPQPTSSIQGYILVMDKRALFSNLSLSLL
jgi:hypothetical protein